MATVDEADEGVVRIDSRGRRGRGGVCGGKGSQVRTVKILQGSAITGERTEGRREGRRGEEVVSQAMELLIKLPLNQSCDVHDPIYGPIIHGPDWTIPQVLWTDKRST
jgi:hypothetical protein